MTDLDAVNVKLEALNEKLDQLSKKLDKITEATGALDVHESRLTEVERKVSALWGKWDGLAGQDGVISNIRNHQASCPRAQIKWVWITLIPLSLTLLATAVAVVKFCLGS